jgi:hypothetical protein
MSYRDRPQCFSHLNPSTLLNHVNTTLACKSVKTPSEGTKVEDAAMPLYRGVC